MSTLDVIACVAPYLIAALIWRWLARQHEREANQLRCEVESLRREVARLHDQRPPHTEERGDKQ